MKLPLEVRAVVLVLLLFALLVLCKPWLLNV
jgi:hypothetical protein